MYIYTYPRTYLHNMVGSECLKPVFHSEAPVHQKPWRFFPMELLSGGERSCGSPAPGLVAGAGVGDRKMLVFWKQW